MIVNAIFKSTATNNTKQGGDDMGTTLMLARRDFDGNPHYRFHFNDICEQLGLEASPGMEIEMIEVHVDEAKIDTEDEE